MNTLRGECMEFLHSHGRDGDNNTAQSRYSCFYNKVSHFASPQLVLRASFSIFRSFIPQNDATKVLSRFDLNKTWREFVFAFGIPTTLFVISFISLCVITRSVKVGDDALMRCTCCADDVSDIDDIDELANKCVQQLNAIEEAVNEQDVPPDQPSTSKVSARAPVGPFKSVMDAA